MTTPDQMHQEIRSKIQERLDIAKDTLRLAVLINQNRSKRVKLSEEIKELVPKYHQAKRDLLKAEKKAEKVVKKSSKKSVKKPTKPSETPNPETLETQPVPETLQPETVEA